MKKKSVVLTLFTLAALMSACSKPKDTNNNNNNTNTPSTTQPGSTENNAQNNDKNNTTDGSQTSDKNGATDTTTGPSWVTDDASLEKAVKESWIVIITKDLKTDKELVFEGGLKKGDTVTPRLLALYNQDENRVKTASYTLTIPKVTFKEEGSRIKGGTVVGDVYVEANNFELVDATIQGNIHFKDQAAKDSFKMDDTSKVTGTMEVSK